MGIARYMGEASVRATTLKWDKIYTNENAGAFTWQVPNGITHIGVVLIGGGASGSAIRHGNESRIAAGGNSGDMLCAELDVTAGQRLSGNIGNGGAKIKTDNTSGYNCKVGNNGADSNFMMLTAKGGLGAEEAHAGGEYRLRPQFSANGQVSYDASAGNSTSLLNALTANDYNTFGGVPIATLVYGMYATPESLCDNRFACYNQFERKSMLGAGGSVKSTLARKGGKDSFGKGGGNSAYGYDKVAIAADADSPGCGGGAASVYSSNAAHYAMSGAGASGAIYIYVLR